MNKIINGDCLIELPKIKAGSIDLIITSPPYDAEKEYEGKRNLDTYKTFARKWTSEAIRCLSVNGSLWINLGYTKTGNNTTLPLTYLYWQIVDIPFVQEIVWHYEGGMSYKKRFTHRTERWMWFSNNPDKMIFNLDDVRDLSLNRTKDKRNNKLGKNPTDYWYFNRVVAGTGKVAEKTNHPCQFPEQMIERIIKSCSNEGDLILDPMAGSFTVDRVCKKLLRQSICIEKDLKYFII